jgi:hypothetical protein
VTARSTLRPCAGVRYSELDGEAVLYAPADGAVHRLSPAAAGVWLRFDGRPLAAEDAAGDDVEAVIELARRLRALGLAEDAGPDDDDAGRADPSAEPGAGPSVGGPTRLPGRLVDADGTVTLVLDADGSEPWVDLDRATLAPRGTPSDAPVRVVLVVDADAEAARPVEGIDALRAVVGRLPPDWFTPMDALDRLAELVEATTVLVSPTPALHPERR